MDTDLFSLFQISLANFFDIKFRLWHEYRLDPEWVEGIPYWEYQLWIDKLNDAIEKQNQEAMTDGGKVQVFNLVNPSVK